MTHRSPFLSDALSVILPTPDQTLLLCACLWTGEAGREAWTKWQSNAPDPKQALKETRLSIELLSLLCHALERNQVDVDKSLLPYLKTAYVHEELRSQTYRRILKETVSILTAAGISFLVLDGAVLAERFYGDWALRHCHDINFLLKKEDISQAVDALSAEGSFEVCGGNLNLEADDLILKHISGLSVRLHYLLFQPLHYNPPIDDIWRCAEEMTIDGVPINTLCIADHLLHILGRASSAGSRYSLRWICDAYYLLNQSASFDWNFLFHRTAESHLVLPFWILSSYLAKELKVQIPSGFLDRLATWKTTKQDRKAALLVAYRSSRGFKNLFKHVRNWEAWTFLVKMLILKKVMSLRLKHLKTL